MGLLQEGALLDLVSLGLAAEGSDKGDAEVHRGSRPAGRDELAVDDDRLLNLCAAALRDLIVEARIRARALAPHDVARLGEDDARRRADRSDNLPACEVILHGRHDLRVLREVGRAWHAAWEDDSIEEGVGDFVKLLVGVDRDVVGAGNVESRGTDGGEGHVDARAPHDVNRRRRFKGLESRSKENNNLWHVK